MNGLYVRLVVSSQLTMIGPMHKEKILWNSSCIGPMEDPENP